MVSKPHRTRFGFEPSYGGQGFVPGHWKADRPTGKVAIPEGPQAPVERPDPGTLNEKDGRRRDPRTAQNIAAHQDALTPRRFRPGGAHDD